MAAISSMRPADGDVVGKDDIACAVRDGIEDCRHDDTR
jgi:hypothetical protein